MCNDNSIQMLFLEKFYHDNQGNFKYQNLIKVESILLQKFVNKTQILICRRRRRQ